MASKTGFLMLLAGLASSVFGRKAEAPTAGDQVPPMPQPIPEPEPQPYPTQPQPGEFDYLVDAPTSWQPPASAEPYLDAIHRAEMRYSIPHDLLTRLLYQESRFRQDIIDGSTISSAGAVGIAQIVPRWHPTVDPYDPWASIDYAAAYLSQLRGMFGSWELALAAYNWGPGNLQRQGIESAPLETRNYIAQITADVEVA